MKELIEELKENSRGDIREEGTVNILDLNRAIQIVEKHLTNQGSEKSEEVVEKMADFLHTLRVNWYVHQKYNLSEENSERRERQAQTSYKDLSEEDKEKDREIARKLIKINK